MMQIPMRRFLPSAFFFLLSFFIGAQEQDSSILIDELNAYKKKDSVRVNLLVGTAESLNYSDPDEALRFVDEALTISSQIGWEKGKALALRQKGNLHYVMGVNLRALDAYQQALIISKTINDRNLESGLLGNLGNIHADMKEYDEALEKYRTYLEASKELGRRSDQIKALTNIGIIYTDMDKHDKGIAYLEKALSLSKEEENDLFIAAITNNLGLAYKGLKAYSESLDYYEDAARMAKKIDNKYIEASALNSVGKINILLGNFELAKSAGLNALEISVEIDAIEWQADSWQVLSDVYENEGKSADALMAYKRYINLRDSVLGEEKKSEITKKEMQFELERQEAEANATIQRQTLIKNMYLLAGILVAVASLIGYLLYKRKRDALAEKNIAEFNTKVAETELKALRSQMNPHFIFNSLNSISDYMSKNDVDTADEYLMKFAKLTRAILEGSEKKWITLEEDLELIKLYLEIEALRFKNKLDHSIKVDSEIDVENTLVPPLLLQPFIENSIWHGIAKKETKGNIDIEIKLEDKMLVCRVDDDGVGRKKVVGHHLEKESMGIKITKNRLDVISQLNKMKGSIDIFDKKQGLRVELKLPLKLNF